MSNKKIVPLGGKHKSFSSLCAGAAGDESFQRGFVIGFDSEGVMHFGEINAQASDVGMALMYLTKLATEFME